AIQSAVAATTVVAVAPTSSSGGANAGMLDLTSTSTTTGATSAAAAATTSSGSAAAGAASFGSVRLSGLSMDALSALLAQRGEYKKALLSEATVKLEKNPGLADARSCQDLGDAAAGGCVVTPELRRKAQADGTAQAFATAPAARATVDAALSSNAGPPPARLPARRHVKLAALPQIERKVAVVIGVNDYADTSIPSLSNAVGDAQAIAQLFEARLGYETVVIPNATKAAVIGTLNRLALSAGPRDSVMVYYAGHGDVVDATKQGYWLLSDADAKRPETWLSNNDIGKLIGQIGASQVALISDSCYSGSLVADSERIRASATPVDPAQVLQQKSVVVMSSGGNEPVSDAGKQGHSPFAWNLMNQLDQLQQWQAGGNVFERVRFAVSKELPQRPQYGASSAAGHQRGGDYLFEQRQLDAGAQ
ncbi:caspase family protein, partial [Pelomonas sp. KK5]|uniref:caspase family protein n=1 Tax=Pelomonas sp. KK5 TaxID=1855730 RepID=UPI0011800752